MIWRIFLFLLIISPVHASNWYYNSEYEKKLWKYAEQLSNNGSWNSPKSSEIYKFLEQIPDSKVDLIVEYALKYFKKEIMKPYSAPKRLFDILKAHKPKNLKAVCEYLKIFKDDNFWLCNSDVWNFFEKNGMKRLRSVCDWTLKLCLYTESGYGGGLYLPSEYGLLYLLSGVIGIPEERLEEICSQTLKFTTKNMCNFKKLNILRVFKDTPPEKWNQLCEYASKTAEVNDLEKYADALIFWKELPSETIKKILKNDPSIDEPTFDIIKDFMEIWRGDDFLKILLENSADVCQEVQ